MYNIYLDIIVNPKTVEDLKAVHILKSWAQYMCETGQMFSRYDIPAIKRAYYNLLSWIKTAEIIPYVTDSIEAANYIRITLRIRDHYDLINLFDEPNYKKLTDVGFFIPMYYTSPAEGHHKTVCEKISAEDLEKKHGIHIHTSNVTDNHEVIKNSPESTPGSVIFNITDSSKSKSKKKRDLETWKYIDVAQGIPLDLQADPTAWMVCYDAKGQYKPKMYKVEPGYERKKGAAANTGNRPYNLAVEHQYADECGFDNIFRVGKMMLKTWIKQNGKPIKRTRKPKK